MSYQKLKVIEALSAKELEEQYLRATELANAEWCNVHAIRDRLESNYILRNHYWAANLVTDAGDVYYAQRAAGESPTNDFAGTGNRLFLRTASDTPNKGDDHQAVGSKLAGSDHIKETGYPRTNDPDSLNNVTNKTRKVTWKYIYTTTEGNHATIYGGAIHAAGASPTTTSPLLTHFTFSGTVPFEKTSSDTLTVYVNHELLGA